MKTRQKPSGWEPTIQQITIGNMLWEDVYVKSLGIYFCKNKDIGLEMNWSEERILKNKTAVKSLETEKSHA